MNNGVDYYKTLGVDQQADVRQIKESYRKMAFKFHPDRNRDNPAAAEQMKTVNEAYAVLSDPAKRQRYDQMRQQFGSEAYSRFRNDYSDQDIFSGSDIHAIFEEVARSFGLRGFDDIFKEFYGAEFRTFEVKKPGFFGGGFIFTGPMGRGRRQGRRQGRCRGRGAGRAIPRMDGLGRFSRFLLEKATGIQIPQRGADIHDVIQISGEQAQQGGPYAYFLRKRNKKLVVKIPPGVRDGQRIRLAGMGESGKAEGPAGDLFLKVKIKEPLLSKLKGILTAKKG